MQFCRTHSRIWLTVCILLPSLFFGQLGIGTGLLTALSKGLDDCCERACPCESETHSGADEVSHEQSEDSCPENNPDKQCLPGCDDCKCCPGTIALTLIHSTYTHLPHCVIVLSAQFDEPLNWSPERLFRPPKSSLI